MSWLKIDDAAPDHPKWMTLAEDPAQWAACWGLWVACAAYSARQLTDGFVPRAYVARATPLPAKAATGAAAALVRAGLWEATEGGYVFHDWLDYNPSAEEVREKRGAANERMKRRRVRPIPDDVRANFSRTDSEQTENFADSSQEVRDSFANPVPVPLPLTNTHPAGERTRSISVEHQTQPAARDVYLRLHEYARKVVEKYNVAAYVLDPGPLAGRHRVQEALNHPEFRDKTPEQVEHAIEMVGAQADEKAKSGEDSSYGLLACVWRPQVLAGGLACPDEKTARQRAVRRSGKRQERPGVKSAPNSHYRDRGIGECEI